MIADRLARVRLSAGTLQTLVLAGLLVALVSLALAVAAFQRQASVAQREARAAVEEAVRSGEASRLRSCDFVGAFITPTGDTPPQTQYGQRIETAARAWLPANRCPKP